MSSSTKRKPISVTTDIVIFSIIADALNVLLIERGGEPFKGKWALPGGFVDGDESVADGAARELEEETGVRNVYLEQLYTFGAVDRDPRGRVITVAYYALVPSGGLNVRAASDARDASWYRIDGLPELAFDHGEIVATAHARLIAKLGYSTIAFQMMPQEFTLSQLQRVYEVIGGEALDKRNFRKSILALEMIEETGNLRSEGAHRPAKLFRLREPGQVRIVR